MTAAVVIPVKSFTLAKGRLAGTLDADRRSELARSCADAVVSAAAPLPVYVVCSDDDVAGWARSLGARVVICTVPGLDTAVAAGREAARADGLDHLVVAHADLPLARDLARVIRPGRVSLVPDRHRDGTNVLAFPICSGFRTAYGPGSFDNHLRIAADAGLDCDVIEDPDLALDLDTADDLGELDRRRTVSTGGSSLRDASLRDGGSIQ